VASVAGSLVGFCSLLDRRGWRAFFVPFVVGLCHFRCLGSFLLAGLLVRVFSRSWCTDFGSLLSSAWVLVYSWYRAVFFVMPSAPIFSLRCLRSWWYCVLSPSSPLRSFRAPSGFPAVLPVFYVLAVACCFVLSLLTAFFAPSALASLILFCFLLVARAIVSFVHVSCFASYLGLSLCIGAFFVGCRSTYCSSCFFFVCVLCALLIRGSAVALSCS